MNVLFVNQMKIFFIFVLCGMVIGIFFDVFRILRKSFATPDWLTYVEDVMFWLLTCFLLAYTIFTYNNGEIRFYVILAVLIGTILYILTISRYVVKTSVVCIRFLKKWIYLLLISPLQWCWKQVKKWMLRTAVKLILKGGKSIKNLKDRIRQKIPKKHVKKRKTKKEFI